VAAAAARLAHGARAVGTPVAEAPAPPPPARRESAPPRDDEEPKVRLSMAVGKKDGIRPADVVGSIANEAGISGREIGPIEIRDEITYVTIPARYRDEVIAKLGGTRFRGRPVNLRVAGPEKPARFDRDAGKRSFVPKKPFTRNDRPARAGKPFPPKGKPFGAKGKPFPPKGKTKKR
ncbi:MAG: DbpA RNA binding domain-containing protein, partial [bacterium]